MATVTEETRVDILKKWGEINFEFLYYEMIWYHEHNENKKSYQPTLPQRISGQMGPLPVSKGSWTPGKR